MAAVTFSFGSKPGLNEDQACTLAELLALERNLAAQSACGKIRAGLETGTFAEPGDPRVVLNHDELSTLVTLLAAVEWPADQPAWPHLRVEAERALGTR